MRMMILLSVLALVAMASVALADVPALDRGETDPVVRAPEAAPALFSRSVASIAPECQVNPQSPNCYGGYVPDSECVEDGNTSEPYCRGTGFGFGVCETCIIDSHCRRDPYTCEVVPGGFDGNVCTDDYCEFGADPNECIAFVGAAHVDAPQFLADAPPSTHTIRWVGGGASDPPHNVEIVRVAGPIGSMYVPLGVSHWLLPDATTTLVQPEATKKPRRYMFATDLVEGSTYEIYNHEPGCSVRQGPLVVQTTAGECE